MSESDLWKYVKEGMLGRWHSTRIESSSSNGVPDVTWGIPGKNGWMELKNIDEWPKRKDTKIKLPLRAEQKLWIKIRGRLSGSVWVLCRIEKYHFLLNSSQALEAYNGWTKDEWLKKSTDCWIDVNFNILYKWLDNRGRDKEEV